MHRDREGPGIELDIQRSCTLDGGKGYFEVLHVHGRFSFGVLCERFALRIGGRRAQPKGEGWSDDLRVFLLISLVAVEKGKAPLDSISYVTANGSLIEL